MKLKTPTEQIIDDLYLAAFSRLPRSEERNQITEYVASESDQQKALQDVLWVLLNSKEFMFNH